MADPRRTQKQIAERYKGNLGYYRKLHPWRLARMIISALAIVGGIVAIVWFQKHGREEFFNAGTISSNHATFANDCKQCHQVSEGVPRDSKKFVTVVSDRFHKGIEFVAIDRKCEVCHQQHTLHESNVVENRSCSACHMEHQGRDSMRMVAAANCAACHNKSDVMQASAAKGTQLPADAFHIRPHPPQQLVFEMPRPARGYTQVFDSFANGHPEFQLVNEKPRDPDVLRFNHQRHLTGADIPQVNGKKLDCDYCHKPDPQNRFYERVTFAANCQACHSLQFDVKNPEMQLPHGDATAVRAYLHSLPTHYADLAIKKGMTRPEQIQTFVAQQVSQLRDQVRTGEELERRVFFTNDPYKPQRGMVGTRASFYGCAFCHDVKAQAALVPAVTKPVFVDRWMPQAHFTHAKHTSVSCDACHHAAQSRETSDVLMPAKANCVTCHSPQGKVAAECTTCHTYHAPPQTIVATAAPTNGLKRLLTGENTR
jgi:hypothetical protein